MWRITIIANALMMVLFWLASLLSIAIAYYRFPQFPANASSAAPPLPPELALSTQLWMGLVPLAWVILSYVTWRKVKDKEPGVRSEYLLAFTTITIVSGFAMLLFFALAGILPIFFIKTVG